MENDFAAFLDLERTKQSPQVDRIRFTPTSEVHEFLVECKEKRLDISTVINLALSTFIPKTRPNGFSWEGIGRVTSPP